MNSPQDVNEQRSDSLAVSETRAMVTQLSLEEFTRLLDSSIAKNKSMAMSMPHSIGGKIDQNNFVLRKMSGFKNGFARDLHGSLVQHEHGLQIVYRFELHMIVRVMFTLWFFLVSIILLVGVGKIFFGELRLDLILGPLILLAGGIMFVSYAVTRSSSEEKELENFLQHLANAAPGQFGTSGDA